MVAWVGFVLQRVTAGGITLTEVHTPSLRIGRGTNAELRSENPAVALEHAVIDADEHGYTISDRGSVTGTYVDGRAVETVRLSKGSLIEIGDLHIAVQVAEPRKPLFLTISASGEALAAGDEEGEAEARTPVEESGGLLRWPKIDYTAAFRLKRPYLTKLSVAAVLAGIALVMIGQVTRPEKQTAFMPGGVSSAHVRARDAEGKLIAERCDACHEPWSGIPDTKCLACHPRAEHSEIERNRPACGDCHSEHRGVAKLAAAADTTCISCHGSLAAHIRPGKKPSIPTRITQFGGDHPKFLPDEDPNGSDVLHFDHKRHLKAEGQRNGLGERERLQCESCHSMVETRGDLNPEPLQFEKHCQRCHRLTFDGRFPDAEIPHGGDPGLVYGYVVATYAGNQDLFSRPPEEIRRMLSSRPQSPPDARAILNAEQVIKIRCALCHSVENREGRLVVTPPVWRTRWIHGASFAHAKHRNVDCESCHRARLSSDPADVLMPVRDDCARCHAGGSVTLAGAAMPRLASSCVTCHRYHDRASNLLTRTPPLVQGGRKGAVHSLFGGGQEMLGSVLLVIIVLLLLVVLIPVSIALVLRIRRSDEKRLVVKGESQPVPLTANIPPLQPEATPASPRSTAPSKTEPVDLDVVRTQPGGTEMIEWFGMLACVSGPIEGQQFRIENEGFYIGRDPELSSVVIDDIRVSKRHVRIFPRDGKIWAIDHNSTNGTFLANAPQERITEVPLTAGAEIIIGDGVARFRYHI